MLLISNCSNKVEQAEFLPALAKLGKSIIEAWDEYNKDMNEVDMQDARNKQSFPSITPSLPKKGKKRNL